MVTHHKPVEIEQIACDICLKEVPLDQATVPEGTDYVVHFCGLECYEKWKSQNAKPDDPAKEVP